MKQTLDIGIVGLGWVARDYMLPALAAHPAARLAAVCSVGERDFEGLADGVARYRSLPELLAHAPRLDGVYVATPNHLHAEQAVALLEAGIPVLLEKPMAPTAAEAARIVAAAERAGAAYVTAYDQRHHPAHLRMRELIAEGRLGTLTQVRIDYACWVGGDWSADNWRVDRARAGGGAVIDLAPHGLDLAETITGQRITALAGFLQHAVHDYAVDDGGALVGRFEGGALLAHTVGYNRPETLPRRLLTVVGTHGQLEAVDTMGQTPGGALTWTDAATGASAAVDFDVDAGPFLGQLAAFIEVVRGVRPARPPADDLRLVRLLEAAVAPTPKPA